jgi:hypothetical protein
MHTHAEIAAFLFGALSLPLAVLFVISVGQRLFLIHRKHVHDQWMYEQQQEIKLEQLRSLPLSSLTPVENDDDVLRLSNQSTSSGHYLDMSKRPKVSRLDRIKKLTAIMS